MVSPVGPYWFFLNSSSRRSLSGCSPSLGLDALEVLPEPESAVPSRRAGYAGARRNARQARMAQHRYRTAGDHRQCLHVHGEGIDLHAVNLVAGESAGQRVDADILRLDVARGFVELAIERRHLDLAALADAAHSVASSPSRQRT